MAFETALRLVEVGLALAILQRGAEHLRHDVWLFVPQMVCAGMVLAGFAVPVALFGAWAFGVAQLWQFRGPYNGGADKMLLLGLTCATVATTVPPAAELALAYLAVQLVLSYVVSGWVKLRNPEWRSGQALAEVFAFSIYPISTATRAWASHTTALRRASWAVIGFEVAFPLALVSAPILWIALAGAATFHLLNAWMFGLNRFVWAWLPAFPALIWLQSRLLG